MSNYQKCQYFTRHRYDTIFNTLMFDIIDIKQIESVQSDLLVCPT